MEVDETHKDEPATIASVDPSDGFERSKIDNKSAVKAKDGIARASEEATTTAGGFMREVDVQQEEQAEAQEAALQQIQSPPEPQQLLEDSPSRSSTSKSRNSLNLVISPAGSEKQAEESSSEEDKRSRFSSDGERRSLQIPRSDPPPTPPTRLASSNIKRRSSRSPNSAATSSSSPFAASTALQNAVTSSSSTSPTPSTSRIDSSPNVAASTSAASSSSMKRTTSSPNGSPNNSASYDVFGSNVTPNKRLRSQSPSSSPKLDGSSSPLPPNTNGPTQNPGSSSNATDNTPPSPSSSPLPDSDIATTSKSVTTDPLSSPTSAASSSSSAHEDDEESGPQPRKSPTPRRVKVYALHESNWIDLGTGSCTWHRSVIRRSRRANIGQPEDSRPDSPRVPPSPPPVRKELTILGRASRDATRQEDQEDEIVEEIVDIEDNCYLEEDEDEAAWIEVVKEGRWKNDAKPAKARQRTDSKDSTDATREASPKAEEEGESKSEEEEDEWERVWTTRIEKPELTASGFEVDSFFVQAGIEEGEEVIGRYRRQQDTLIVWKSSVSDTELALSFAATAGCLEIWEFLKEIHMRWEVQMAFRERETVQETEESQVTHHIPASTIQDTPKNGLGLDLGRFSQIGLLQDPALGNLVDLEKAVKMVARTALGREKLSTYVGRTGFIQKLVPVFKEAEDLESLTDLHTLCVLMHDILNLNDHGLWELILNDDIFFDVISILEYDPAFPNMKAAYRAHLSDPSLYVEVVPIPDDSIKSKIHQIYRLQYMKDVILPRVLDDNAFQIVNSIVYFNQVDIVQYLSKRDEFWDEIFQGTFPEHKANGHGESKDEKEATSNGTDHADSEAKQQDAIAFLQSFAQMVKQLQLNMRTQHFHALSERGMLRVLDYALSNARLHEIQPIRIAVVEILMLLVDNDPSSIRSFVLKEHEKPGKQRTLMTAIINAFHTEEDLGAKAQLAEAIRILLLPPGEAAATETAAARTRPDDPHADSFLQYFYENGVATLLEPLTKGISAPAEGSLLELPISKIALYTHLCDLLCFFVISHSFRSKFFILSSSVTLKITALLRARPKHIRLAALRYFRACVGRNDDFYNRYLVKNGMVPAILELTKQETVHDNLLASACLELFEYLRLNPSSRIILNDLMSKHEEEVKSLSTGLVVFQGLLTKWEQLNEPMPTADMTSSEADIVADVSKDQLDAPIATNHRDDRALTVEEEDYFNADDDDDEDSQVINGTHATASGSLKRTELSTKDGPDQGDPLRRKRQKLDLSTSDDSSLVESMPDKGTLAADVDADSVDLRELETQHEVELARIREKRKRAEDEEDDADFLTAKKASQDKDKENTKVGIAAAKTKNVSGKLKLFFGKKP